MRNMRRRKTKQTRHIHAAMRTEEKKARKLWVKRATEICTVKIFKLKLSSDAKYSQLSTAVPKGFRYRVSHLGNTIYKRFKNRFETW